MSYKNSGVLNTKLADRAIDFTRFKVGLVMVGLRGPFMPCLPFFAHQSLHHNFACTTKESAAEQYVFR